MQDIPKLWQHQEIARDRAKSFDFFGLFFDIGTGKTRTIIEILQDRCNEYGRTLKTLIITPVVVVENFKREILKFSRIPKDKVIALTGTGKEKIRAFDLLQNSNFVCLTNYEALYNRDLFNRISDWKPEAIILDEFHKIKSQSAKRTKLCIILSRDAKYRYGLSGTPILNTQLDLFTQIQFLDHGATLGKNFFIFRSQYFYDVNAARRGGQNYFPKWIPRPETDAKLKHLIAPFTMTAKKSECLDLPKLLKKEIRVEMGEEQAKAYKSMKKDFIAFIKDKACTAELSLTKALRLQQIVSGFVKLEDDSEVLFNDVPRLTVLRDLLEDIAPTNKIIVWAVFKKNYQMIETVCKALGLNYCMLHGETKNRQEEIDKFQQDNSTRVMIANQGAGGIGVNLTAASYMIYYSKNFSLEQDMQSEGRCYRGGSEIHESITRIDIVCKNTIDDIITEALELKKEIGANILSSNEILQTLKNQL